MRARNPDTSTLLLVGAGLFLWWRSRRRSVWDSFGNRPVELEPPPSYAGWPAGFGGGQAGALTGAPCTTTNGQPGTWQQVRFGAVQVGGVPQQWVCWPSGVPFP